MSKQVYPPRIEEVTTRWSPREIYALVKDEPHSVFLDDGWPSRKGKTYSFIAWDPFLIFRCWGGEGEIIEEGKTEKIAGDPFEIVRTLLYRHKIEPVEELSALTGGAIGYLGYDLKDFIEELPARAVDDLKLPDCYLCFYDAVIIYDHLKERLYISSTGLPDYGPARQRRTYLRLREVKQRLREGVFSPEISREIRNPMPLQNQIPDTEVSSNFTREQYIEAVGKVKKYIRAGDIFQVNLSQRLKIDTDGFPFEIYQQLRHLPPAPFSSYLNLDGFAIASTSPERFLRISDRWVQTRPIKGTRPRGNSLMEDNKLARELLHSSKDRAELLMIVDLERNDLGRVCQYGTVVVPRLFTLEKYYNVFHLVSTVEGRLREGEDHIDCLRACFPGGSITGAPKIRAMEIIDELEPTRRGIYTGSIGYLGFNGETDLNIVIRTAIIVNGKAYFQVGGGIVEGSIPEREYEETLTKARAMLELVSRKSYPLQAAG